MKDKIYISGKITGRPKEEYLKQFADAETKLISEGYIVINPAKVLAELPKETKYDEYMILSMEMLKMCNAIYILEGWRDSQGAFCELIYAIKHGYIVMNL